MEQKKIHIVEDFAAIIYDLCLQMGHKNIVGCDVVIEEMRDNGIVIQEQKDNEIHFIPIGYRKEISKFYDKDFMKIAYDFDLLLYYEPSEAKELFIKEFMKHFEKLA